MIVVPNRSFLIRFGGKSSLVSHGSYFAETQSSQNTHGETKRACYASEAYQKGTIRYLPHPNLAQNLALSWDIRSVTWNRRISVRTVELAFDWLIANLGTVKRSIDHHTVLY